MKRHPTCVAVALASIVIVGSSALAAGGVERSGTTDRDGAASSREPNPVVTPATGGEGQASGGMSYDVTQFGYMEREYLIINPGRSRADASAMESRIMNETCTYMRCPWCPRQRRRSRWGTTPL